MLSARCQSWRVSSRHAFCIPFHVGSVQFVAAQADEHMRRPHPLHIEAQRVGSSPLMRARSVPGDARQRVSVGACVVAQAQSKQLAHRVAEDKHALSCCVYLFGDGVACRILDVHGVCVSRRDVLPDLFQMQRISHIVWSLLSSPRTGAVRVRISK